METDQGNRPDNSEECSAAVPEVVEGWCANCTCYIGHSLESDDEVCLNCGCSDYDPTPDADLMGRICLPKVHSSTEEIKEYEPLAIFLGKISRGCDTCGEIKLYKEFNGSKDPAVPCNYCSYDAAQIAMLLAMDDKQRREVEEMEEAIIENELAYEEALERQEMIDDVLRGLDE